MPFPVEDSFVDQLESALGAALPACYKAWMMGENGGTILLADDDWELHPIQDTSDRKRLSRTANHVLKEQSTYQEWANNAPDTLTIAANGCGDRLVLKRVGSTYQPDVFRWDHETGELTHCAPSISDAVRE